MRWLNLFLIILSAIQKSSESSTQRLYIRLDGDNRARRKIWNRENLFDEYFKNIIPEILPNGIVLRTVDSISDENGVAIIQEGDAEGKNGEYDNKYVWVFKMKEGQIYSIREYNSDILVATQLYDYEIVNVK